MWQQKVCKNLIYGINSRFIYFDLSVHLTLCKQPQMGLTPPCFYAWCHSCWTRTTIWRPPSGHTLRPGVKGCRNHLSLVCSSTCRRETLDVWTWEENNEIKISIMLNINWFQNWSCITELVPWFCILSGVHSYQEIRILDCLNDFKSHFDRTR